MLSLVLIKTRNVQIPTMKIRQIEYQTGFLNSTLWNPKAQVVNKAQRQLRPESYFPEFFKSRAQGCTQGRGGFVGSVLIYQVVFFGHNG